jgi:hypothetical protein
MKKTKFAETYSSNTVDYVTHEYNKMIHRQTLDRQTLETTNPGHDKPWTGQTLDTTNPGQNGTGGHAHLF